MYGGWSMPVYEYECGSCKGRFEVTRKFSDPELTVCKLCGAETIRKILSPTAFVLKGSGWYATDYASKSKKDAGSAEKPGDNAAKPAVGCASGACCAGACPPKAEA
jgi:putative FmdB family regulatory protein